AEQKTLTQAVGLGINIAAVFRKLSQQRIQACVPAVEISAAFHLLAGMRAGNGRRTPAGAPRRVGQARIIAQGQTRGGYFLKRILIPVVEQKGGQGALIAAPQLVDVGPLARVGQNDMVKRRLEKIGFVQQRRAGGRAQLVDGGQQQQRGIVMRACQKVEVVRQGGGCLHERIKRVPLIGKVIALQRLQHFGHGASEQLAAFKIKQGKAAAKLAAGFYGGIQLFRLAPGVFLTPGLHAVQYFLPKILDQWPGPFQSLVAGVAIHAGSLPSRLWAYQSASGSRVCGREPVLINGLLLAPYSRPPSHADREPARPGWPPTARSVRFPALSEWKCRESSSSFQQCGWRFATLSVPAAKSGQSGRPGRLTRFRWTPALHRRLRPGGHPRPLPRWSVPWR